MFNTRPIQDICPESLRNKLCESHKNKKLCPNRTARKDIEFFHRYEHSSIFCQKTESPLWS